MQSVAFISSTSQDHIKLISSTPINHTKLESNFFIACTDDNLLEGSYSIHSRYGGLSWQYWFKGCLEAQVVSLLGSRNLASMRGKGKLNVLGDP